MNTAVSDRNHSIPSSPDIDAPLTSSRMMLNRPFSITQLAIRDGKDIRFEFAGHAEIPPHKAPHARKLHRHAHYEMVYVLDGEFIQHFESGTFRYQKGDACFLNRNIQHREGYESDCDLIFLNMHPEYLGQIFQDDALLPDRPQFQPGMIQDFLHENLSSTASDLEYIDCVRTMEQQSETSPLLSILIGSMIQELNEASTGYAYRIRSLLLQTFSILEDPEQYHLSRIHISASPEEIIYTRVLRYLEERHGHVTREELGALLNYNGDYLNRLIKKYSGQTLASLGKEICLKQAADLLSHTDRTINEIINDLGYTNCSHFYRLFHDRYGMTPREWRKHPQSEVLQSIHDI